MFRFSVFVLLALTTLCLIDSSRSVKAQDYAKQNQRAAEMLLGRMPGYTFRPFPTGNFGVGTMYLNERSVPVESRWLVAHPSTWFNPTVPPDERKELLGRIIEQGSGADVITLSDEQKRKMGFGIQLPLISQLLGLSADSSNTKNIVVTVTADRVIQSRLNWTEFLDALEAGKIKKSIIDLVKQRNIHVGAAEVSYDGYTIKVDASRASGINAALAAKAKAEKAVGEGAGLKLDVSSSGGGKYELRSAKPVVIAVLYKVPPKTAGLSPVNDPRWRDIDLWDSVNLSTAVKRMKIGPASSKQKPTKNKQLKRR